MSKRLGSPKFVLLVACVGLVLAGIFVEPLYTHYRTTSYCGRQGLGLSCLAQKFTRSRPREELAFQPFIMSNGRKREYLLLQSGQREPRPTLIVFHGVNGNGREALNGSGLGAVVLQHGFVGVFPNALGGLWNAFPPGKVPASVVRRSAKEGLGDDVLFVKELTEGLVRRGISDPKRIYLVGLSMGGFMALRMACVDANDFAGVGLIASSMPDVTGEDCGPFRPLPLLVINGTADHSLPYAGGSIATSQYNVWATDRTLAFFRNLDGCSTHVTSTSIPRIHPQQATSVTLYEWNECSNGRVGLYRIEGGEHEFPPIGIDAAAELIAFFDGEH